jgi:hypothetical protein
VKPKKVKPAKAKLDPTHQTTQPFALALRCAVARPAEIGKYLPNRIAFILDLMERR